jgi:hypothetical protein
MAARRWVFVVALLGLGLTGSVAAAGVTGARRSENAVFTIDASAHHDGLVPVGPPAGALTAVTRNQRQQFSKLLAVVVLVFAVIVTGARRRRRLWRPRPITETPGTSIRRRGPPQACFSASI